MEAGRRWLSVHCSEALQRVPWSLLVRYWVGCMVTARDGVMWRALESWRNPEEWRCWVCGEGIFPDEERERVAMIQRKRLGAMRMRNTSTSSATGMTGTNGEVSSLRQGQKKAEGGEEAAQVNGVNGVEQDAEAGRQDGHGVGAGRMRL